MYIDSSPGWSVFSLFLCNFVGKNENRKMKVNRLPQQELCEAGEGGVL